jgi:hypothetical protein
VLALRARSAANGIYAESVRDCEGVGVTDSVYPDALTPPIADSYGWMLTGDAVVEEQSPGSPAVARTGRMPLLIALLERNGADLDVLGHSFGVAFPCRLSAPMPGGSEGHRRTGVSWRCDGR